MSACQGVAVEAGRGSLQHEIREHGRMVVDMPHGFHLQAPVRLLHPGDHDGTILDPRLLLTHAPLVPRERRVEAPAALGIVAAEQLC